MNADRDPRQRRKARRTGVGATSGSASSPGDPLAEYAYPGIGRIGTEDDAPPQVTRDYDTGTPGSIPAWTGSGE